MEITTIEQAIRQFRSTLPEIVDHFEDRSAGLPADRTARFREFDDREEWVSVCPPDLEHDCWREGCGISYVDAGHFGAVVEIFDRNGRWTTAAMWSNYDSGGRGF